MTWLDFVCFFAFFGLIFLASKRGVILEATDLICIVVGGFFSFRTFRPIANFLHGSIFKAFNFNFLQGLCLFLTFTVVFLTIFGFALNFQRKVKENKKLDADVDSRLGIAVGFVKTMVLIQLFLGFVFYNDAFPSREVRPLKNGAIVSRFLGLSSFVKPIVYVVAPSDLADGFMEKGLGTVTPG